MAFVFVIILCCSTLPLIGECVLLLCNCVTFNVSYLFLCRVRCKTLINHSHDPPGYAHDHMYPSSLKLTACMTTIIYSSGCQVMID